MTTITFDTNKFVRDLQSAGIGERESEAITNAIKEAQSSAELATKGNVEALRRDMREMELRMMNTLTLRMGGMLAAGMTIVAALVKLL